MKKMRAFNQRRKTLNHKPYSQVLQLNDKIKYFIMRAFNQKRKTLNHKPYNLNLKPDCHEKENYLHAGIYLLPEFTFIRQTS